MVNASNNNNDLYTMFYMAEALYISAETTVPLASDPNNFRNGDAIAAHFITVYLINTAFAIELYLKCLAYIEKNKYKYGHNLYILFTDLSKENQYRLTADFAKTGNQYDLPSLLKEAGDTFNNFRYLFEDIKNKFNSFRIPNFIPIIRNRISELRSDLTIENYRVDKNESI